MDYDDFVWFILSEEHKTSATAVGFWFRLLDVDGDGLLTLDDMGYFYEEQARRQAALGHEPVPFLDVAAQLIDAIHPRSRRGIALTDLRRSNLAPLFISSLTNIHRFLAAEGGDARGGLGQSGGLSEWDVWAAAEYARLEEEEEEMEPDETDGFGKSMDASPFDCAADAACEGLPPPPAARDATATGHPKGAHGMGAAAGGGVRI
jgi:serine/threonine-protein phosphatase 2A regulatory subunit B''